jgi:hypothetical protein
MSFTQTNHVFASVDEQGVNALLPAVFTNPAASPELRFRTFCSGNHDKRHQHADDPVSRRTRGGSVRISMRETSMAPELVEAHTARISSVVVH